MPFPATGKPFMGVASDGAHLPPRPKAKCSDKSGKGRWQEAKGFRVYLLDKERIIHIASWHKIQKEEEVGKDPELVASRIPKDSRTLCVSAFWAMAQTGYGNL